MRRPICAWLLLLGLHGPAAGQDEPRITVTVRDVVPHLERALLSKSLRELLKSEAVVAFVGKPTASQSAIALLRLLTPRIPARISLAADASIASALVSVLTLRLQGDAVLALEECPAAEAEELRAHLAASFADAVQALRGVRAVMTLDWRGESVAEQMFDQLGDQLTGIVGGDVEATESDGVLSATMSIVAADGGLAGEIVGEVRDALVRAGREDALRELNIDIRAKLDGARVVLSLCARGAPELALPTQDDSGNDGELLSARWQLGDLREAVARLVALQQRLHASSVAAHLPELDADIADTTAWSTVLAASPSAGSVRISAGPDDYRIDFERDATGREVDLVATRLLARVPLDVELWAGSGQSTVVEIATELIGRFLDRAAREDSMPDAFVRALTAERDRLVASRDAFVPGWVIIATADGALPPGVDGREHNAPAVAVLARAASVDAALQLARDHLEPLAAALGARLERDERSLRVAAADERSPIGPGFVPHAFAIGDVVVLSTSDALTARIRSAQRSPGTDASRALAFSTSGRRLADLTRATVDALFAVMGGARSDTIANLTNLGGVAAGVCELFGAIRGDMELRARQVVGHFSVAFAESEAGRHADLLRSVRTALAVDATPADRALVARGTGTYLGARGKFEFAYAPDGRFRETMRVPYGFDIAFDETAYLQDTGYGLLPEQCSIAGTGRAWAAAMSGQWLRDPAAFAVRVSDVAADGISIVFHTDGDLRDRRIVVDPVTFLPRSFDYAGAYGFDPVLATELTDHRRVLGRMLPHRIVVRGIPDTEYEVESWSLEEIDATHFSGAARAHFQYVVGAEELAVTAEADELLVAGSVGGQSGWFSLTPLHENPLLAPEVFDALVAEHVGEHVPTARVLIAPDVTVGPLQAERFAFLRLPEPVPEKSGRRVLGYLGVEAMRSCCVDFDLEQRSLRIRPPGSLTGPGFRPLALMFGHTVFGGELRGGVSTWFAPMDITEDVAIVKPIDYARLAARSRTAGGPLEKGELAWLEAAGHRMRFARTAHDAYSVHSGSSSDETPIAIGVKALDGLVLELDFANSRYRLRERAN